MKRLVGMLFLAAALVFVRAPSHADTDPAFITFGAGWYDFINQDDEAGEFRLEYWSDRQWWVFKPFAGVMATTDAALYGHVGIRLDLFLGKRFVLRGCEGIWSFARGC